MSAATRPTKIVADDVVGAALRVITEHGKLSMRLIAEDLGVSVMAAYRHVEDQHELVLLCVNARLEPADLMNHRSYADLVHLATVRLKGYPPIGARLAEAVFAEERIDQPLTPALTAWKNAVLGCKGERGLYQAVWLVAGAAQATEVASVERLTYDAAKAIEDAS